MPSRERLRAVGLQQADHVSRRLGREARHLRWAASLSQAQLASAIGVSRGWLSDFELGRLQSLDLKKTALLFAHLGHKLVTNVYPTGEPMRDAGQARLLERFNARLSPAWRRTLEAAMPIAGDLRAWDELLVGPVSIGVEAETRPRGPPGHREGNGHQASRQSGGSDDPADRVHEFEPCAGSEAHCEPASDVSAGHPSDP
jgi:transcriptional regulator with XRE-family HTH domain